MALLRNTKGSNVGVKVGKDDGAFEGYNGANWKVLTR